MMTFQDDPPAEEGAQHPVVCRNMRLRELGRWWCWMWIPAIAAVIAMGANRLPAKYHRPLKIEGAATVDSPSLGRLRVATLNIHGGKGDDGVRDLSRTAAALKGFDFIALNEVHGRLAGNQAHELGCALNLRSVFAPSERRWWHDHFGNAILTRLDPQGVCSIPLPGTQAAKYRVATLSSFTMNGQSVRVLITHLEPTRDRKHQLETVIALFQSLQSPALLMGDLNTLGADPQLRALLESPGVDDVVGDFLPSVGMVPRIDWIIARGLRTVAAGMHETPASDHPLVWAEFEWE